MQLDIHGIGWHHRVGMRKIKSKSWIQIPRFFIVNDIENV